MFVPIPTEHICDLSSRSSRYIATTVCRTWTNPNPATYHLLPETIALRPDGTGTLSSSYLTFPAAHAGPTVGEATQGFTWRLARDGPLGMEDMDGEALYGTMPALMKSTRAWTHAPWTATHRIVPAYLRITLVGESSLEREPPAVPDFRTDDEAQAGGVRLPAELIEDIVRRAAAEDGAPAELLGVCKWTREVVLGRRRRERFAVLTQRFATWGLAFWMTCGHFNPTGTPQPASLFALRAQVFKLPIACGYDEEDMMRNWDTLYAGRPVYYACALPVVQETLDATFWRMLKGQRLYDERPEVEKEWDT